MGKVLDLKKHPELIQQYVELRNSYSELLMTHPVGIPESMQWVQNTTAEIWVVEEDESLLGVVLLYIDRGGEVAFFARHRNKGIGTRLLQLADEIAKRKKLSSIWAWVRKDNPGATNVFRKCGYRESGYEERTYKEQCIGGIRFTKTIEEN